MWRETDSLAVLVYGLSYWHYLLYWKAYCAGAPSPAAFRRNAVAAKTLSMVILAWVYLSGPFNWLSVMVAAIGVGLNALAAGVLGTVRTYYGSELGEVPPLRVTAFPYSVVPHPMLIGNLIFHAGLLLAPAYRAAWWPLACGHLVLNASLIVMETRVTPGGRRIFRQQQEVR